MAQRGARQAEAAREASRHEHDPPHQRRGVTRGRRDDQHHDEGEDDPTLSNGKRHENDGRANRALDQTSLEQDVGKMKFRNVRAPDISVLDLFVEKVGFKLVLEDPLCRKFST